MSLTTASTLRVVLYEGAEAQPLPSGDLLAALRALLEKGFAVTRAVVNSLVISHERGPTLVLGNFAGGKPLEPEGLRAGTAVRVQDITGLDAARIAQCAEATRAETG